jgi:hypothetical protein
MDSFIPGPKAPPGLMVVVERDELDAGHVKVIGYAAALGQVLQALKGIRWPRMRFAYDEAGREIGAHIPGPKEPDCGRES